MNSIDLHCDTASRLLYENLKLRESKCKVDIQKLKNANAKAQVFAHFIELNHVDDPYKEFIRMYNFFVKELKENENDIEIVRNLKELEEVNNKGKIGAFLSIEEGEVLQGKVERVKEIYDMGVRFITLTWNFKNSIGYPNSGYKYKDYGLTDKGKEIVLEMEKVGIIPDCSHLSDGGFYDLVKILKKPFVATHSNSRAITDHSRNLTDDMIVSLADKGGVMGLNFCAPFLGKEKVSSINSMIAHIKHIKNVGGVDILALGTDFDGIENEVEIKNIGQIGILREILIKEGFKNTEIDKIFYGNIKRVLKEWM